jgi:hypothetical protein
MSGTVELVKVKIVGLPLDAYQEAAQHTDGLMREFALIRDPSTDGAPDVPRRLLDLVERLGQQFQGFTGDQEAALAAAVARGVTSIDLEYLVPAAARDAAVALGQMLDEADEYCRRGGALLTLATPPRALAFRRWFLDQFVRQIDGQAPEPWAAG